MRDLNARRHRHSWSMAALIGLGVCRVAVGSGSGLAKHG
jgi:hypothetical protein